MLKSHDTCTGCETCRNICPRDAITMAEDDAGFRHPVIDPAACIGCGTCEQVCTGAQRMLHPPLRGFAAAAKDSAIPAISSSGGVFPLLAANILRRGGRVYGAASFREDGYELRHVGIDVPQALSLLQGSKYIQSRIDFVYRLAQEDLQHGIPVLFSGTPCQIAGLRAFLGKAYPNLLTVDILCHGVSSRRILRDYLAKYAPTDLIFRDKSSGWLDYSLRLTLRDGKTVRIPWKQSSFYSAYLRGKICRESCDRCPYARTDRVGDLTLGDFWGFRKAHPDAGRVWKQRKYTGISSVLVNSEKGMASLDAIRDDLDLLESTPEKIAAGNGSLHPRNRAASLLPQYREQGYAAIEAAQENVTLPDRLKAAVPLKIKQTGGRLWPFI